MSLNPNAYAHLEDDAAMIQAAVDDAAQSGERVEIPRRNARTGKDIWILPRAIRLYSGSTVILDNCHLRLADGAFDNIFKNSIARTEEAALVENRQYDICIAGMGNAVLDGGNHNGLVERNVREKGLSTLVNTLIHFHNAQRIVVENLRMVNARYWGMTFHFCSHGRVSNLHFQSCGHCPNQDGIDLRLGCCDFLLENITGYTQDDSIALTCLNDAAIQKVAGMDDSIHNVIIRNIATNSLCANVRLLNHYGRRLYNVIIENVQSSVETDPAAPDASAYALRMPDAPKLPWAVQPVYWTTFENRNRRANACVRIGENGYFDPHMPDSQAKLGDMFNITVRNVQTNAKFGVTFSRTLCDSYIDNVQMFGDGGIAAYFGEGEFENIALSNISYARNARPQAADLAPREGNYGYDRLAPVYFHHCVARNLRFSGIAVPQNMPAAFAGEGEIHGHCEHIWLPEGAHTVLGDGIELL